MSRTHSGGGAPPEGGRPESRRRRWLALAVAVMVGAVVAFAPPASGQDGHDPGHGDGLLPPGDWTEEQEMFLLDLIERTEAALPAFSDVDTIAALGFENFGGTAPGGYDHWTNQPWIDDEFILDPEHPESLVFRHMPDGGYQLQAAMFFLPSQYDLTNIPEELAWLPGWHTHPELCVTEDGKFAGFVNPDGTCFSGMPADMPPMMHVWIVDNECGHRFAGVDAGGLICDLDHHEEPPTTEPPQHPTTTMPSHPTTTVPDDDHPVAPPARPVRRQPTFTG